MYAQYADCPEAKALLDTHFSDAINKIDVLFNSFDEAYEKLSDLDSLQEIPWAEFSRTVDELAQSINEIQSQGGETFRNLQSEYQATMEAMEVKANELYLIEKAQELDEVSISYGFNDLEEMQIILDVNLSDLSQMSNSEIEGIIEKYNERLANGELIKENWEYFRIEGKTPEEYEQFVKNFNKKVDQLMSQMIENKVSDKEAKARVFGEVFVNIEGVDIKFNSEGNISINTGMFISDSRIAEKAGMGDYFINPKNFSFSEETIQSIKEFQTRQGFRSNDRIYDVEIQALNQIAEQIQHGSAKGEITIIVTKENCHSCLNAKGTFESNFPDVKVTFIDSKTRDLWLPGEYKYS